VVLAVGFKFSQVSSFNWTIKIPPQLIQIDIDSKQIGKNYPVAIGIAVDAKVALRQLLDCLGSEVQKRSTEAYPRFSQVTEWKKLIKIGKVSECVPIKPLRLIKAMRDCLDRDAIITTEVGQNQMWAALNFKVFNPRTFISSGGLGTMGFGFPAAIGAKVAKPDFPVVDIAGDGSFIMSEQDLATCVSEQIPVIVIVLNNSMLGMVAQWQRLFYNRRYSWSKLGNLPDFVKLAEAYGAQGFRVETIRDFSRVLKKALKSDLTTVIDVPISPEEDVFPMVPAGAGLKDIMLS